jgi:ferric-dicitrate binding protein FerR (iron transport regulator)
MILAELNRYYDRLVTESDPDTGKSRVPGFGFSEEKIGAL